MQKTTASFLMCWLAAACSTVPDDIARKAAISCQNRGMIMTVDLGRWRVGQTAYEHCYHETVNQLLQQ